MTANVSLLQLRTRSRRRADLRGSPYLADAEVNDIINEQLSELYDLLVEVAPPHYYYSEQSVTITGATSYPLPSDFRSLIDAWADLGNGMRRPLREIDGLQRSHVIPANDGSNVILSYVPAPPTLLSDSDTFDGVSGWDSLITRLVARQMVAQQEDDTSSLDAEIMALRQRIQSSGKRNLSGPRKLPNIRDYGGYLYGGYSCVRGFALRTGVIELYQPAAPFFF